MEISFKPFTSSYYNELKKMIHALYDEDPDCHSMTDEKIECTVDFLTTYPNMGRIVLLYHGDSLAGYAILVFSWSNEYGGIVVLLDELYLMENYRNQGIGTEFIRKLIKTREKDCVAILLEVMHSNERAGRLYRKLGFESTRRNHLIYKI